MDFMILHQWFHENLTKLNRGTCHCMAIDRKDLSHKIMLNNKKITSSNEEKLSGILLDSILNFESRISSLYRPKNKFPSQFKELPYIGSKKLQKLPS